MPPKVQHSSGALPLALIALALVTLPLAGQDSRQPLDAVPPARLVVLAGVVRDTAGRPLSGAEVRAADRATLSEADGTFLLRDVAGDTVQVLVRRIGYRPADMQFSLEPHVRRVELAVKLVPAAVELGTIIVEGRAMSTRLLQTGFYDRQKLGLGTYIDAERVERFGGTLAALLREVPRAQVRYGPGKSAIIMGPTGKPGEYCPLHVFLDGVLIRAASEIGLDHLIAKEHILAVEVYPHAARVPPALRGYGVTSTGGGMPAMINGRQVESTSTGDCGTIAIWTKPFEPQAPEPGAPGPRQPLLMKGRRLTFRCC